MLLADVSFEPRLIDRILAAAAMFINFHRAKLFQFVVGANTRFREWRAMRCVLYIILYSIAYLNYLHTTEREMDA